MLHQSQRGGIQSLPQFAIVTSIGSLSYIAIMKAALILIGLVGLVSCADIAEGVSLATQNSKIPSVHIYAVKTDDVDKTCTKQGGDAGTCTYNWYGETRKASCSIKQGYEHPVSTIPCRFSR